MTLNDVECRNSPYFTFFSRHSIEFQADYITVVEDRRIMSVKYCLPVLKNATLDNRMSNMTWTNLFGDFMFQ